MPTEERPFWQLLPEIYREDELLSRLVGVFEEAFLDMESRIDRMPDDLYLPRNTPEELLPLVGRLVGLQNENGLFTPEMLRALIPAAFRLQEWKGTRWALDELLRFYLRFQCGYPVSPRIVEYGDFCDAGGPEVQKRFGGPEQVTVLLPFEPALSSAEEAARLEELLREYTPAPVTPKLEFCSPLGEIRLGYSTVL